MPETLLELIGLSVRRGKTQVLSELSLSLGTGEVLAILGASGSGKTTLLLALTGLMESTASISGRALYGETDLLSLDAHRRGMPLVLQDLGLFEHLNVLDNVTYPLRLKGTSRRHAVQFGLKLLAELDLDGLRSRKPAQLSGGQRQRVALARALAPQARLLLLDEPTSALDASTTQRFVSLLERLRERHDNALIVTTHDRALAARIANRIAVLDGGRLIQIDAPRVLHERPAEPVVARLLGHLNLVPFSRQDDQLSILGASFPSARPVKWAQGTALLPETRLRWQTDPEHTVGGDRRLCIPGRCTGLIWREGIPVIEFDSRDCAGQKLFALVSTEAEPSRGENGYLSIPTHHIHLMGKANAD